MALGMKLQHSVASRQAACSTRTVRVACIRSRTLRQPVVCQLQEQAEGTKSVIIKNTTGDLPLPWSEKDPYRLPMTIQAVQQLLMKYGWEKPWVEQIIDRIMKGMLRTTEERTKGVVTYLNSIGLRHDEICNMASISVVLLGLNPETRLKAVVDYLAKRGVPASAVPDIVLKHPRIFEYKVMEDGSALEKGKARIQVDVIPTPSGSAIGVNYFRAGTSFLASPVSPVGPLTM